MAGKIIAVVTTDKERVGGGAPIFVEPNEEQLKRTAFLLEKILDVNAHDVKNGIYILVDHG